MIVSVMSAGTPSARAGQPNTGQPDAGQADAGHANAGPPDTGHANAGQPDAGHANAGQPDAGHANAGRPDSGHANAGPPDAGHANAGRPDSGHANAGQPDAGHANAGRPEAGYVASTAARGAIDDRDPDRQDAPGLMAPRSITRLRRLAAIGAAIVPGILVRGAGSWIVGERRTAKRLFTTAAIGAAAIAIGGLAVGGSNASPYLTVPGAPVTVLGAGLFLPSWAADIWVAGGGGHVRGTARAAPPWSVELAGAWLHDAYRERGLARVAGQLELGRLGLGAAAMIDGGRVARTGELEARWRIRGAPATGDRADDGSRLLVRAAVRALDDDADGTSIATVEAEVIGRLELRHLDDALAGTFGELSAGLGVERVGFGAGVHELHSLLLGRFAWGMYLGDRGEVAVFYDHRRDSLAGGLAAWRAAGFVGSFGAALQLLVTGPWALRAELEVGSAYVSTFALRYHGGAR